MDINVDEIAKDAPIKNGSLAEATPTSPERSGKEAVDAQSLAGLFGVRADELSPKDVEKINSIVGWVKQQNTHTEDLDLAWAIVQKRNQLGHPRVGNSVIDHMYQWYKASKEYQEAEQRLQEVELGNGA